MHWRMGWGGGRGRRPPSVQFSSFSCSFRQKLYQTRHLSSRMRTDHAVRPSSEGGAIRPIVDRQTPVKTLPSLAVGNNSLAPLWGWHPLWEILNPSLRSLPSSTEQSKRPRPVIAPLSQEFLFCQIRQNRRQEFSAEFTLLSHGLPTIDAKPTLKRSGKPCGEVGRIKDRVPLAMIKKMEVGTRCNRTF